MVVKYFTNYIIKKNIDLEHNLSNLLHGNPLLCVFLFKAFVNMNILGFNSVDTFQVLLTTHHVATEEVAEPCLSADFAWFIFEFRTPLNRKLNYPLVI